MQQLTIRRYNKYFYWLLLSLFIFYNLDLVTTYTFTSKIGAHAEGNPLARYSLENWGFTSLIFLKYLNFLLVASIILWWKFTPTKVKMIEKNGQIWFKSDLKAKYYGLIWYNIIMLAVVAWNTANIVAIYI